VILVDNRQVRDELLQYLTKEDEQEVLAVAQNILINEKNLLLHFISKVPKATKVSRDEDFFWWVPLVYFPFDLPTVIEARRDTVRDVKEFLAKLKKGGPLKIIERFLLEERAIMNMPEELSHLKKLLIICLYRKFYLEVQDFEFYFTDPKGALPFVCLSQDSKLQKLIDLYDEISDDDMDNMLNTNINALKVFFVRQEYLEASTGTLFDFYVRRALEFYGKEGRHCLQKSTAIETSPLAFSLIKEFAKFDLRELGDATYEFKVLSIYQKLLVKALEAGNYEAVVKYNLLRLNITLPIIVDFKSREICEQHMAVILELLQQTIDGKLSKEVLSQVVDFCIRRRAYKFALYSEAFKSVFFEAMQIPEDIRMTRKIYEKFVELCINQEDYKQALKYIEEALTFITKRETAYLFRELGALALGKIARSGGDLSYGEEHLKGLGDKDVAWYVDYCYAGLAKVFGEIKDIERLSKYAMYIQEEKTKAEVDWLVVDFYLNKGAYSQVLNYVDQIANNKTRLEIDDFIIMDLIERGAYKEALKRVEKALEICQYSGMLGLLKNHGETAIGRAICEGRGLSYVAEHLENVRNKEVLWYVAYGHVEVVKAYARNRDFEQALRYAEQASKDSEYFEIQSLVDVMVSAIEAPSISIQMERFLPLKEPQLLLTYRNIREICFKIIILTPELLLKRDTDKLKMKVRVGDISKDPNLSMRGVRILQAPAIKSWVECLETSDNNERKQKLINLPELEMGRYCLVATDVKVVDGINDKRFEKQPYILPFSVSNLGIIECKGFSNAVAFVVDSDKGVPLSGVKGEFYEVKENKLYLHSAETSDSAGMLKLPFLEADGLELKLEQSNEMFPLHCDSKKETKKLSGANWDYTINKIRTMPDVTPLSLNVELAPATNDFKLNNLIKFKGKIFDGVVPHAEANIFYRVVRSVRFPKWMWWKSAICNITEIASGQEVSDKTGAFDITFEAISDEKALKVDNPTFDYKLEVFIEENFSEVKVFTETISLGYWDFQLNINTPENLQAEVEFAAELQTIGHDNKPVASEGSISVVALKQPLELIRIPYYALNCTGKNCAYDFRSWEEDETLKTLNYKTDENGVGKCLINGLKEGVYKLVARSIDGFAKNIRCESYIIVTNHVAESSDIKLPFYVRLIDGKLKLGDTLKFAWTTGYKDAAVLVAIEQNAKQLEFYWSHSETNQGIVSVPITESLNADFTVKFSMIKENVIYQECFFIPKSASGSEQSLTLVSDSGARQLTNQYNDNPCEKYSYSNFLVTSRCSSSNLSGDDSLIGRLHDCIERVGAQLFY
jgi:tetratricopeptide (TPR) repeat protein